MNDYVFFGEKMKLCRWEEFRPSGKLVRFPFTHNGYRNLLFMGVLCESYLSCSL